jgi:TM2 domain-containing membrane protein YozV
VFTVIGADGKEYGPASAELIRQWIAEGRADAATRARREGEAEWRSLGAFAEFAGGAAPPPPPPLVTPPVPARKSKIAAGLMGLFLGAWGVHRFYLGYTSIGVAQIIVSVFTCGVGALWGFIEGILILTGTIDKDAYGQPLGD